MASCAYREDLIDSLRRSGIDVNADPPGANDKQCDSCSEYKDKDNFSDDLKTCEDCHRDAGNELCSSCNKWQPDDKLNNDGECAPCAKGTRAKNKTAALLPHP